MKKDPEAEIKGNIIEKIHKLTLEKAEETSAILKDIKLMKEEGSTEKDPEILAKVIELEKIIR